MTGQRAAGFLLRFQPDVLDLKPQFVVIEVSSYNFRPNTDVREIFDYVGTMAALARCHGIEPILTTCIPPRDDYEVDEHEDYIVADTAALYSGWVAELAGRHGYLSGRLARRSGRPKRVSEARSGPNEGRFEPGRLPGDS